MSTIWTETGQQRWQTSDWDAVLPSEHLKLIRLGDGPDSDTALICPAGTVVHVNGERIWSNLRVLRHKDEIIAEGQRLYFSTQITPELSHFQAAPEEPQVKCAICRVVFQQGDLIVRCPGCGRLYHQTEEKPCFTYRAECRFCSHPTSLSGEHCWRPEAEESDE